MIEKLVRKFLYYPLILDKDEPLPSYARDAKEIWIESQGDKVHALYWPANTGRPTMLYLHGNAQSVYEWALVRHELATLDCGLLLLDYPGYGKSSGKPSEEALYDSGFAALKWLNDKQIADEQIIVLGKSLGGGVTSEISQNRNLMAVILESTFTSIPAVAKQLIPVLPEKALFKTERYDSISKITSITAPILVIHGTRDELIPFHEAEKLFDKANKPKQFYKVEGAGHNDVSLVAEAEYGQTIRQWLDAL